MTGFAERMGHRAARTVVQTDGLDEETRIGLWNVLAGLREVFGEAWRRNNDRTEDEFLKRLWLWHFKQALDEQPQDHRLWQRLKELLLTGHWIDVLDLLEASVRHLQRSQTTFLHSATDEYSRALNDRFEMFLVGSRLINGEITPVDSTFEALSIDKGLEASSTVSGSRHHLERAIELLADRAAPDYPNSMKESVSAVEALVKKLTGEGTLGAGVGKLEAAGVRVHPALKKAWTQLYGWTSDEAGVRHGSITAAEADQATAKYLLVVSSAFVSYLTEQGRRSGLI